MHEIIETETIGRLFWGLTILTPILGLLFGWQSAKRSGNRSRSLRTAMLIGGIGPVNLLLWYLYNAITDRNGLDSIQNLFINLVVFVVTGALIGTLIARSSHHYQDDQSD